MACTYFESRYFQGKEAPRGVICGHEHHRLLVNGEYILLAWHDHLGPDFYYVKGGGSQVYEPKGAKDPVWKVLENWLAKRKKAKEASTRKQKVPRA